MLELIDKALESSNMGGDSPRDCVFEVYRPDFDHIKPPQDMDMSANVFSDCCSDFEWIDDSDDEEAQVPSGRISPCTFLEWSKDCTRWNADEDENKEVRAHYFFRPNFISYSVMYTDLLALRTPLLTRDCVPLLQRSLKSPKSPKPVHNKKTSPTIT